MIVREMRETECYDVIRAEQIGRLACSRDDQPYIVPIQYAYSEASIFSFSMPGKKIEIMRSNHRVCLEIEHFSNRENWCCVLVDGNFRELTSKEDRQGAWILLQERSDWWEPGALKPGQQQLTGEHSHVYYEIEINSLTGRQAMSA